MPVSSIPIDGTLFTGPPDEPRLAGSRCRNCALMTFPTHDVCPRCGDDQLEDTTFDRRGTLWTYTTQEFVPKSPPYALVETDESFEPYAVGYVEFAGQGRIEGRIIGCPHDRLAIGMEMEVVRMPFRIDEQGRQIVTYAFRPVS